MRKNALRLSEKWYIQKRKLKAGLSSLVFYVFRIFPIHPRKIVMWTFEGSGGYTDSPKYIAEELLRRSGPGKEGYEIVWLVNSAGREFPAEIRPVKNSLLTRAYHMSTAAFWISNTRTFYGTKKRKGTTYIQTWHAIAGIKPTGMLRGNKLPEIARIVSESDSSLIDYVLSGNEWTCKMRPASLLYKGTIVKTGIPRCDILFYGKESMHKRIRKKYGLPAEASIILYAPTFRGGSQRTARSINIGKNSLNFTRLVEALEKRFGGIWYVFLRLHPQLSNQIVAMPVNGANTRAIDVSQYPDMNELIAASDAMLTDYSSSIFESSIMEQPGFLFVEDEEARSEGASCRERVSKSV